MYVKNIREHEARESRDRVAMSDRHAHAIIMEI